MLDTDANQLVNLVGMVLVNLLPGITNPDRVCHCLYIAMEILPQEYGHWDANVNALAI